MEAFVTHTGLAAPLMAANIDTDLLIPSREINHPGRDGFGPKLLAPWRYRQNAAGEREENPDFILNQTPFRQATVLLAGDNFGCGSSREAAVWALRQFGFRSVIAPSFGSIFRNNCYRNGLLPVVLAAADVAALAQAAAGGALRLTVSLRDCAVSHTGAAPLRFDLPASERAMLLEGLDAIGLTLKRHEAIAAFEQADRLARPWMWSAQGG